MENTLDTQLSDNLIAVIEQVDITKFRINYQYLKKTYEFKKANDPAFRKITFALLAQKIGICESTLKKIMSGQAADCHVSVLWGICKAIGADIRVALYLAPESDLGKESENYNSSLMNNLRLQVKALEEKHTAKAERLKELEIENEKLKADVDKYRGMYHESDSNWKSEALNCKHYQNHAAECAIRARRFAKWMAVSFVAVITLSGLLIYLLWEIRNPTIGNIRF